MFFRALLPSSVHFMHCTHQFVSFQAEVLKKQAKETVLFITYRNSMIIRAYRKNLIAENLLPLQMSLFVGNYSLLSFWNWRFVLCPYNAKSLSTAILILITTWAFKPLLNRNIALCIQTVVNSCTEKCKEGVLHSLVEVVHFGAAST